MSIVFLSAVQQLRLLRAGKISASELAEEHIAQITRLNPTLNALVDFDPERMRRLAADAPPGPLHGLPLTIKSSLATAGHRCEIGSLLFQGQRPLQDAQAVATLRQHGAVLAGTSNCPEFLMAYETDNRLHGRTRNPWALDRSPGGSSGGEAAAIAAGFSAAGLGSDSGGSVRQPAHATGICALKPTSGRVSAEGHLPPCVGPFARLGAVGPMARSVADLELLFSLLANAAAAQVGNAPVPYRRVSLAEAREIPIGWFEDDGLVPVTAETRQAVRRAAERLRRNGFRVEPFRPRFLEDARRLWTTFFVQCGAMFYQSTIAGREEQLSPIFTEFLERARRQGQLSAPALLDAWAEWDGVCARLLDEMRGHPILLLPVCSVPAFRHGERLWHIDDQAVEFFEAMRFTQWFNVLGAPAAVVPVGQSAEGLPIGVQIAGRPFEDERVLAVADVLDQEFGFRKPPLA